MKTENLSISSSDSDMFFNLIKDELILISYKEEDNEGKIVYSFEEEAEWILENKELFSKLNKYVNNSFFVASMGGFEAPSEYYKAIKAYVESEGDGKL